MKHLKLLPHTVYLLYWIQPQAADRPSDQHGQTENIHILLFVVVELFEAHMVSAYREIKISLYGDD